MSADSTQDNSSSRKWIIILCVDLLLLAILWSVDSFIFYLLLATAVFCFFKVLQLRPESKSSDFSDADEVEDEFNEPDQPVKTETKWQPPVTATTASTLTPDQKKTFVVFVAGFIGFIFFFIMVGKIVDLFSSSNDTAYQQQASDFYYNQQYDSAAYSYRLALQSDPENANLWFERGNAFLNSQQTDSALIMYRRAVELRPSFEQAQYNIAYIYFDRKNYKESIAETRKVLEINPEYVDAKLLIGDSFYNQSQLDSALQWYKSSYESGYRSAILCHLMAYIHDTKGRTQVAIELYKEAIAQDSTITDIYVRLGELVPGEEGERFRTKGAFMSAQNSK